MNYDFDDTDNSWLDSIASEEPVAPVHTIKPRTSSEGLFCLSDEYCAKISAALKGRTKTSEHRAKISAALKGRTQTSEHRAKVSAAIKGRTHTAQTRAKMKGRTHTAQTRAKIQAKMKGRTHTAETCAKIQANSSQSKPIMTPTGAFPSKYAAGAWAQAHGLVNAHKKINKWLKTQPTKFYYLPKETK